MMNQTSSLTLRQRMEVMPLIFNPNACPDLEAKVQLNITGSEPGVYTLQIANNECVFQTSSCPEPSLSINAPSNVWLGILRGQISGQDALAQSLYSAQGDLSILQKWDVLFQMNGTRNLKAPASQRLAGPIQWSGSTWMAVALISWIIFWISFGSFGFSAWISVGIPLLLSAIIVGYRLMFNRPDWLEMGGLAFFTLGGVLSLAGIHAFTIWGTVWSNLILGILWLASLIIGNEPLSMQYVKWQFDRRIWGFGLFMHINAVISLVWGFQTILAAMVGTIGVMFPSINAVMTILRYLTMVPAYYFTARYTKAGRQNPPKDIQRALNQLRIMSAAGIVFVIAFLSISILIFK